VQFENIASPPPNQSPQLRYACLHRTIERGLANDDTWAELTRVCVTLQLQDEALRAFEHLHSPTLRHVLNNFLVKSGVKEADAESEGARPVVEFHEDRAGVKDHLRDAVQFLFQDHMPLMVIIATLTFPLVVGLGGFMTQGTSMFLLPIIALLPGLSVLAILGGMGRRILLEAANGMEDPPKMPTFPVLARESARFTSDLVALGAVFLGPAIAATLLGVPGPSCVVAFVVGAALLPMAMVLRQLRGDWQGLDPRTLMRAVRLGGRDYFAIAGIITAMFLPAMLAGWSSMGASLYLQVSVIGPLAVLPIFVVARILGTFVYEHRDALRDVVERFSVVAEDAAPVRAAPARRPQVQPAAATQPQVARQRAPQQTAAPQGHPQQRPAGASQRTAQPQQRPQQRRAAPAQQAQPGPRPTPRPQAQAPAGSQAQPHRQAAGRPATSALRRQLHEQREQQRRAAAAQQRPAHPEARRAPAGRATRPAQQPAAARQQPVAAHAAPAPQPRPTRAAPVSKATAPAPAPVQNWTATVDDMPDYTKMPGFQVLTGEARRRRAASRRPS